MEGRLGQDEQREIERLRKRIDGLDGELVRLISERATAANSIGRLKQGADLPVYEPKREQEVFANVRRLNAGPLSEADMLHVYERIIDVMRGLQRRDGR